MPAEELRFHPVYKNHQVRSRSLTEITGSTPEDFDAAGLYLSVPPSPAVRPGVAEGARWRGGLRRLGCLQYVRRLSRRCAAEPSPGSLLPSALCGSALCYGVKKAQYFGVFYSLSNFYSSGLGGSRYPSSRSVGAGRREGRLWDRSESKSWG